MEKIIGIYKITNTITNDFYIGSSKNVKQRLAVHKCQSTWKKYSNNPMYQDMQKYGTDKFILEILEEVEPEKLKETEQEFIQTLKPIYNNRNANGLDVERCKEYQRSYIESHKDELKQYNKQYDNQLCCFNGETLTLRALSMRFMRQGLSNPILEAKKYILE